MASYFFGYGGVYVSLGSLTPITMTSEDSDWKYYEINNCLNSKIVCIAKSPITTCYEAEYVFGEVNGTKGDWQYMQYGYNNNKISWNSYLNSGDFDRITVRVHKLSSSVQVRIYSTKRLINTTLSEFSSYNPIYIYTQVISIDRVLGGVYSNGFHGTPEPENANITSRYKRVKKITTIGYDYHYYTKSSSPYNIYGCTMKHNINPYAILKGYYYESFYTSNTFYDVSRYDTYLSTEEGDLENGGEYYIDYYASGLTMSLYEEVISSAPAPLNWPYYGTLDTIRSTAIIDFTTYNESTLSAPQDPFVKLHVLCYYDSKYSPFDHLDLLPSAQVIVDFIDNTQEAFEIRNTFIFNEDQIVIRIGNGFWQNYEKCIEIIEGNE